MARPKVPLISRREVVNAALRILDDEGMHALSIRRLGVELNVNGASLYHHFANKDEILSAVGRAVLAEIEVPDVGEDGIGWIVRTAINQRRALLRHPEVIPLQSRGYLRIPNLPAYEMTREILRESGIPRSSVQLVLNAIEALIVGDVVVSLMPPEPDPAPTTARLTPVGDRHNGAAIERKSERSFELVLRSMLDALVQRLAPPA